MLLGPLGHTLGQHNLDIFKPPALGVSLRSLRAVTATGVFFSDLRARGFLRPKVQVKIALIQALGRGLRAEVRLLQQAAQGRRGSVVVFQRDERGRAGVFLVRAGLSIAQAGPQSHLD